MFLDYFALILVLFVIIFVFYGIIVIHDIPYEISRERNHPHQDAIHVAGWVSLFTLHAIWPFLWIWSTLYREDRGWGFKTISPDNNNNEHLQQKIEELTLKVNSLQATIDSSKAGD